MLKISHGIFQGKEYMAERLMAEPSPDVPQDLTSLQRGLENPNLLQSSAERETSPERGRRIARRIIELESLSYTIKYNEINGPELDRRYQELKSYVAAVRKERNDRDPWDPRNAAEENQQPSSSRSPRRNQEAPVAEEEWNSLTYSVEDLTAAINLAIPADRRPNIPRPELQRQLQIYFRKAREKGLLDGVDDSLSSIQKDIIQGNTPASQARRLKAQRLAEAIEAGDLTFGLKSADPDTDLIRLEGVWNPYIRWANERFEIALQGQEQPTYREGEYRLDRQQEDESEEIYWEPSNYPQYYHVRAKTPAQFRRAKDTFIQTIKAGDLGRSPNDILTHLQNFKLALGQQGSIEAIAQARSKIREEDKVTHEFMEELRLEFEAISYIFGADYSNETYDPKGYNQFMMAMALHEGPARWIRLARSGEGAVGAFLHKFDNDPRFTLYHNPSGSRGQLGDDTVTQHYLQSQIKEILIEESIGILLKDYDSRDDTPNPLRSSTKFKANLERIGLHQSDEIFKSLYEGFDSDNAHLVNYTKFKDQDQNKLSEHLRRSVVLGKVQHELANYDTMTIDQLIKQDGIMDQLVNSGRLSESDADTFRDAVAQAKANFEIAFQMVGATQEKVRRGGGVFFIDRVVKDKPGFIDYMPVYLAEKFVQFAETWTKIKYADDAEVWSRPEFAAKINARDVNGNYLHPNFKAEYRKDRVKDARIRAGTELKTMGFEAKHSDVDYDVDGNPIGERKPMLLKRPKEEIDTQTGMKRVAKKPDGSIVIDGEDEKGVAVDFDIATHHIYSRWTAHTYWGYQPENRHMLLASHIFEAAKRIRDGVSMPEDEDMLATQLLITDPTLTRVRSFPGDQMQKEITLLQAAVEESYQGHWRINKNLHRLFLPNDGNPDKMRMGYNMEDYGGMGRFAMRIRDLVATQPKRFARRLAARIADMPMEISSMPDIWGQEGVLGAVSMFADQINKVADQRVAGQFAITKFISQMDYGVKMFEALVGHVEDETGKVIDLEGLYEKPTNNSDKLSKFKGKIFDVSNFSQFENDLFYAYRESFGRLERVLQIMRVMESSVRNAQGALLLEGKNIFLPDGRYNPEIAGDRYTGTSRHSERIFFDTFISWLLATGRGGGVEAYPDDAPIYAWLKNTVTMDDGTGKPVERTIADWLFDKMAR